VTAVGAGVEILDGRHRAEIELAIEMRKQLIVPRTLPAKPPPERIGIDLDQEQPGLAKKKASARSPRPGRRSKNE
jgi:hypothetical protein